MKKNGAHHVISGPLDPSAAAARDPPSPPLEGRLIGQRMHTLSVAQQSSRVSVYEGILWKRCRVSLIVAMLSRCALEH